MIEVKSVSMNYGQTKALDSVSFKAQKGQILGLLGPNAAGKTTLMRILTAFLYPTRGTALVEGHDITENPLFAKREIGYMPETLPLYDDMIVDEYLGFVGKARGLFSQRLVERLAWVKESCEISPIWKYMISEISRGYRQRVGLAQALIHDPQVLILDEPTTGLDPIQIISVRRLIRKLSKDKTVIFSTHILQEVEALADTIVILDRGRVIANGTREELVQMATKTERAVLTLKGDRETLESSLESLKEVEEVRFEGYRQGGYARFLLRAPTGTPLIPLLNDFIRQNNLEVKELSREEPTLEETFIWLLSRDKSRQR
jgi:ABC-2 type transport system ATP-binding protein